MKSSFPIALICTTRRRIAASASTNQGSENGCLIRLQAQSDAAARHSVWEWLASSFSGRERVLY